MELGKLFKELIKEGMTPGDVWKMTPNAFWSAFVHEPEQEIPDYPPGSAEHTRMVNEKLAKDGKMPVIPKMWWDSVPEAKPTMATAIRNAKRNRRG